jgi:DNA-binding NarL/FixJ family response regulator
VLSPRLAGFVLHASKQRADMPEPELNQQTAREREVLRLLARGYDNKEISSSCRSRSRR